MHVLVVICDSKGIDFDYILKEIVDFDFEESLEF